jgi:hypothetical protein
MECEIMPPLRDALDANLMMTVRVPGSRTSIRIPRSILTAEDVESSHRHARATAEREEFEVLEHTRE